MKINVQWDKCKPSQLGLCGLSVLSMPLADTEQTAGLQSLTPDCLHDIGFAMFSVPPSFDVALPD